MTLDELPTGRDGRIADIRLDGHWRLRLREMGLRDGAPVRVWGRAAFGGLVLLVGGSRVAVDAGTAARIDVVHEDGVALDARPSRTEPGPAANPA